MGISSEDRGNPRPHRSMTRADYRPFQQRMKRRVRSWCPHCARPGTACYCALCHKIDNRTSIVIVQHAREARHAFNTVRIAALTLANLTRYRTYYHMPEPDLAPDCALLFPGPEAQDLASLPEGKRPGQLLVLDGTWSQVRKLRRDNPWLEKLPEVSLNPSKPGAYRIRLEPTPQSLSTIEAVTAALKILEPATPDLDHPLHIFNHMIDTHLALMTKEASRPVL